MFFTYKDEKDVSNLRLFAATRLLETTEETFLHGKSSSKVDGKEKVKFQANFIFNY